MRAPVHVLARMRQDQKATAAKLPSRGAYEQGRTTRCLS